MTKAQKSSSPKMLQGDVPNAALPSAPTKAATVLALLRCEQGATLPDLVEATGWQPHTTRAMLTGLRKKGYDIERRKRGDLSCYHLPVVDA